MAPAVDTPSAISAPAARLAAGAQRDPRRRIGNFIADKTRIRHQVEIAPGTPADNETFFEKAGPRQKIFFDPRKTRAAIVTCGGLCPGLNNVIRSAFLELHHNYGVREVLGIRHGYQGLTFRAEPPLALTPDMVDHIHRDGGTILSSSRGQQPVAEMVDFLVQRGIDVLLCVGGDGTQRGSHEIAEEIARRQLPIAVVGVPKTIDNDIQFVRQTFGYYTAIESARAILDGAHCESKGAPNGIGLVNDGPRFRLHRRRRGRGLARSQFRAGARGAPAARRPQGLPRRAAPAHVRAPPRRSSSSRKAPARICSKRKTAATSPGTARRATSAFSCAIGSSPTSRKRAPRST
jgi:hypothetical protein